jgi:hypothetical protein
LKNAAPYAYVNYALFGTLPPAVYGEHLERLCGIKKSMILRMSWDLQADANSISDSRATDTRNW